jgi:hypothetical protein
MTDRNAAKQRDDAGPELEIEPSNDCSERGLPLAIRSDNGVPFAGPNALFKEVGDGIWLASFMHYDLGYFDREQKTFQPSTTRSARRCHPCLRYGLSPMSPGRAPSDWRKRCPPKSLPDMVQ